MQRTTILLAFGLAAAIGLGTSGAQAASILDEWSSVKAPAAPPPVKEAKVDPKTTALLMLDFVAPICGHMPRCGASLPAVKKLLDAARAHDVFVVYTGIPNLPEIRHAARGRTDRQRTLRAVLHRQISQQRPGKDPQG